MRRFPAPPRCRDGEHSRCTTRRSACTLDRDRGLHRKPPIQDRDSTIEMKKKIKKKDERKEMKWWVEMSAWPSKQRPPLPRTSATSRPSTTRSASATSACEALRAHPWSAAAKRAVRLQPNRLKRATRFWSQLDVLFSALSLPGLHVIDTLDREVQKKVFEAGALPQL